MPESPVLARDAGHPAETPEPPAASRIPPPEPVTLAVAGTAVLVLDLTQRATLASPDALAFRSALGDFLDRARRAGAALAFTASASERDTPLVRECRRRKSEPVFFPDAFDKMRDPAVPEFLAAAGCQRLVITGASANNAVMNTAIGAARHFLYELYIPLDGVYGARAYEFEYAMYHLSHMPASARRPRFTELGLIELARR
jgi:hypothetical protein